MKKKFIKPLTTTLTLSLTIMVIFFLTSFFVSCEKIDDIGSYISYTIKEKLEITKKAEKEKNKDLEEGEEIMLPQPKLESTVSLEEAINGRRSIRSFSSEELSLDEISQLLWAAQGISQKSTGFRTTPSAGALYPLEIFLVKSDGVFHYIPDGHKLVKLDSDDLRSNLMKACLFQSFVAEAPVDIIITAIYERTTIKYGKRGIRYVHLEAGHACQNILLQATALGLGAVSVGAFDDSYIQKLLKLPNDYIPLYVVPTGYPEE